MDEFCLAIIVSRLNQIIHHQAHSQQIESPLTHLGSLFYRRRRRALQLQWFSNKTFVVIFTNTVFSVENLLFLFFFFNPHTPQLSRVITALDITLRLQPQHHYTNGGGAGLRLKDACWLNSCLSRLHFCFPTLQHWRLLIPSAAGRIPLPSQSRNPTGRRGIWRAEIRTWRCLVQILGAAGE